MIDISKETGNLIQIDNKEKKPFSCYTEWQYTHAQVFYRTSMYKF